MFECLGSRVAPLRIGRQKRVPLFRAKLVVIDAKEPDQTVSGYSFVGTHQRRMLVRGPLVKTEQDGSIRIHDLTPVYMARSCLKLA